MLYIMIKDLYQSRKMISTGLVSGVIFALAGMFGGNLGFLVIVPILVVYGTVSKNEFNEEKNQGYSFLRMLPIRPYKIIVSKFITALVLSLIGVIYSLVLTFLFSRGVIDTQLVIMIFSGGGISLIFVGILYSLIYKYGAIKAMNISRLFFLSFFIWPMVFKWIVMKLVSKETLIKTLESLANIHINWSIITLSVLLIYILLMFNSIRLFNKKKIA